MLAGKTERQAGNEKEVLVRVCVRWVRGSSDPLAAEGGDRIAAGEAGDLVLRATPLRGFARWRVRRPAHPENGRRHGGALSPPPHPGRLRPRPGRTAGHRGRAPRSPLERSPLPRRRPRLEPGRLPRHHLLRDPHHRRRRRRRHAVLQRLLGQPRLLAHPRQPDDRQEPGTPPDHRLHPRQPLPLRPPPAPGRSPRTPARRGHARRTLQGPGLRHRPLRQVAPERRQGVRARPADGPGLPGLRRHPDHRQARVRGRPAGRRPPLPRDHRALARLPRREPGPARSSSTSPTTSSTGRCWKTRS